jgi:hypothetical protein
MRNFSEQATSSLPVTIGNASIYPAGPSALDYLQKSKQHKDAMALKQKAQRDKDVDEKLKYSPEAIFHPFEQEHSKNISDILEHSKNIALSGRPIDYTNPDYIELEKKKNKTLQNVRKGEDVKKSIGETLQAAKQDPFTDYGKALTIVNDNYMHPDGAYKKIDEVSPEEIRNSINNPQTLNPANVTQAFVKTIPEQVNQIVKQRSVNVGNDNGIAFDEIKEANKFYNVGPDGKMQINITPETKELFKSMDPRMQGYIDMQLSKPENKGKTEDDIVRDLISPYAYTNKIVNRSGVTKESKGRGSGSGSNDDVTLTHMYNTEENYNLNGKGSNPALNVTTSYSPHEVRLGGAKADKGIYINAKTLIDPNTNGHFKDDNGNPIVGDKKITVTRLRLMPFDESSGKIIIDKEDNIKNKNLSYKWYAYGVAHEKDDTGKNTEKPVIIPYDQVQGDVKEKLGVDLDQRDISQYTDYELADIVKKQYPDATPKQRLEILKKIKSGK